MKNTFIYSLYLILSVALISCTSAVTPMVSLSGETMGTTYSVKYVNINGEDKSLMPSEVQKEIDDKLLSINQLMSTYIPDSELSLLNKTAANTPFLISPETEYVIQEALKLHTISGGMLDITVGPLVNQWGFGPEQRVNKAPSQQQIDDIKQFVGVDKFEISNSRVTKNSENVYIDLSTIAKGYAVDVIANLLEGKGINNYLVEIGGEMRVSGEKLDNQKWLIAIEKPITGTRALQRIVSIGDNAIATSGDYRIYFEADGVRYSHLINPLSGYPIKHNLVAVTVVSPTSIEADGLATALMVMGTVPAKELAEKEGIAALFITKEGDEFIEYQSSEFANKVETIEQEMTN
jgi:thiamine biosynthesis lipoprotein